MTDTVNRKGSRILVVGVGNPILSDDGVGIHIARALKEMSIQDVDVEELPASGLELLDMVLDYDRVIIVDAIVTREGVPGELHMMKESDFEATVHGASPHGINIATALALGRQLVNERMPSDIRFFAIEVEDLVNVSEKLTPSVAAAIPSIIERILAELR